jgi:hypothetical protein
MTPLAMMAADQADAALAAVTPPEIRCHLNAVASLVANLRHYCDATDTDWSAVLRQADQWWSFEAAT